MKTSKVSTEAKVGILVLVGIILLLFMSFRVSRLERLKGEVYTALFPSVSGLVISANVEVAGVPVGRVEKIGLQKGMAKVWMKIGQAQLCQDPRDAGGQICRDQAGLTRLPPAAARSRDHQCAIVA
jgi:ABC-type transporter Mla subunit MlaD